MTPPFAFEVVGTPAPQGSKRHVGNGVMVESSKAVRPWRDSVAAEAMAARTASGHQTYDGPVAVDLVFRVKMPASRPKLVRAVGVAWRTTRPDLDKLIRSTLDALGAAGVYSDDAKVAQITAQKIETTGWTGAEIQVRGLP